MFVSYRYHLAEPDPHSPFRQKFDETEVWAGKFTLLPFLSNRI